ncbi:MAG: nicotinate-nucleotide--dimethylbenzimidazole phosphoribosyltransferase, partial [Alphaproteobacteria bacterium]|nr:nicotinate-nucleotide--dimethylbenzimidazole phosphoribosyltransferase [Alphaproteobacteria bacterium]
MTDFAKNNVATPMVEARPMPVARYSVVGLDTMVQWRDFLHTMAKDHKALQVARQAAGAACEAREAQLTKPPHSLGRLELLTRWFYETHGVYDSARAGRPADIIVFAGNHGVAARGVSAFPS